MGGCSTTHTIPTNPCKSLNYNADRLTGATITQTLEYVIKNGLEYSYVTNGEAFIFLRVREDILPWYIATWLSQTETQSKAIWAGFSAFCLMAVCSAARNYAWRDRAAEQLHKWNEEFEDVMQDIPSSERHQSNDAQVVHTRQCRSAIT
jgi:predicted type IV restriction endonuclease